MAVKKKTETLGNSDELAMLQNPLFELLRQNDKKNRFKANAVTVFHRTGFHLFDYYFGTVVNIHDASGHIIRQEPRIGQQAGTFNLIIGASQSGKLEPVSTPIPTPNGTKRMGDLKVGDKVFTHNGSQTTITGVFPQGEKEIYKITFSNGRTSLCGLEHLWQVGQIRYGKPIWTIKTLKDIMEDYKSSSKCEGSKVSLYKYVIPNLTEFVAYNAQVIPSDTSMKKVIMDISTNSDRKSNVRIPDCYKYNTCRVRLLFLRSLMMNPFNSSMDLWQYQSRCKELIDDIVEMIRGLGYEAEVSIKADTYTVKISTDSIYNKKDTVWITNIEYSHVEEAQCIMIDDPSHLYLTDQFVVTHNTTLSVQIAANIMRQHPFANVIHYDCENRFGVSRCENITKLPASYFVDQGGMERYMIKGGMVALDVIQEMITETYTAKMRLADQMRAKTDVTDEFGNPIFVLQPTVIIIDSITTVLSETLNPNSDKEMADAAKMRGNTEGARDAKGLKGFFKDVMPMCKEANIIIYGINHINNNMSMNAFIPVQKTQNYMKQDEIIPGGKTMQYYPCNIAKLIAKTSDDFTEEGDGFNGHVVMVEPIKTSANQSGNNSKGVSFEMVFSQKYGFDPLRTMIKYGRDHGMIEGNRNRLKFKEDDSFTFTFKDVYKESKQYPIWENINKIIVPTLNEHLPFIEPENIEFDDRSLMY